MPVSGGILPPSPEAESALSGGSGTFQDLSKTLATLDDLELWQRTTAAAQQEKHRCAVVIAHIAEVRKRKLFLLHACHSLFDYCVTVLGFSEAESYLRCQVARICSRFPAVLADLGAGKISLCVAGKLAPRLSEKNQHRLLPACHGKTKQEAEIIIAKENPASLGKSPANKTVILPLNEDFFAVRLPMHKNLLAKLQRCAELLGVASMQAQLPELLEKITDIALAAKDPAPSSSIKI